MPSSLPFVTYPYQDEALLEVDACIGNEDLVIEKSRDMGCVVAGAGGDAEEVAVRVRAGVRPDVEDGGLRGQRGDPKSLFYKVRFLLDRLPMWMCREGRGCGAEAHGAGEPGERVDFRG
jgi:hypothetical protein